MDDLGWGSDDPGRRFALTMEPHALARTLNRAREYAEAELRLNATSPSGDPAERRRWTLACEVCDAALAKLAASVDPDPVFVADFAAVLKDAFACGLPTDAEAWDHEARAILKRLVPMLAARPPRCD